MCAFFIGKTALLLIFTYLFPNLAVSVAMIQPGSSIPFVSQTPQHLKINTQRSLLHCLVNAPFWNAIGMVRCRHQLVLLALLVQRLIDLKTSIHKRTLDLPCLVAFWSTTLTAETAYTTHQSTSRLTHYVRLSPLQSGEGQKREIGVGNKQRVKRNDRVQKRLLSVEERVCEVEKPYPLRVDVGHVGKETRNWKRCQRRDPLNGEEERGKTVNIRELAQADKSVVKSGA
ncbi:hypothetical protein BLNAU_24187 [Blattamonas nauphoetae]|uniref:Secreted protein n=1 Tax=Blattamonas nauphoetae TaxID=2049346 RepID=A0ABQ9WR05_9EUKA|nr:hypothetical protein BLNAU_24187 [Blattamonas nauphoetae]